MATIKVTSEELRNLSGTVTNGANSIQDQQASLRNAVQQVVGEGWEGAASSSFNELWQKWDKSATGLKESLDGISQLLQKSADAYDQTEDQIKGAMSG